MKYRLIVLTATHKEIAAIALWLEERRSNYGTLFIDEYAEALQHLVLYPYAQAKGISGYHQLQIGRFLYYLIYEVKGNRITVYKVIHGSRHPEKRKRAKK